LARAERTAARVALWTALAASLLATVLLQRFARPAVPEELALIRQEQGLWHDVDFASMPEVELLRDLVRIDTSHPDPDELAAAELLAGRIAAAGVEPTIERLEGRRANLWAVIEGERPEAIVLHGHLDVEPLQEEGPWTHPPLSATIDGPWIFGRGMYDMKSLTAAQLLAFLDVARSGRRPERSLVFLATSSEETGSETGTRWILAQHPELVRRFGAVLTEGGVVEATNPSDVKYWGLEFAQKRFARIDFCSRDRVDLESLRDLLWREGQGDPGPDVDPAVRAFLAAYGPTRGLDSYRRLLADPDALSRQIDRFDRLTPFLRSLFRDEVVPIRLEAEPDGTHRLEVSVHLLPSSDLSEVLGRLLPDWVRDGLVWSPPVLRGAGAASPLDHPVFRRIAETIAAERPGVSVGPYFLPWTATDARYFRAAGIPTYGVSPFAVMASETTGIARIDERMQLPAYVAGVALYRRLVADLVE